MALAVDQLPLGPIGTNCYLVRSSAGAEEAVVVDPSGPAAEILGALSRAGSRCTAILVTHGHWDHVLGVAELAEATGAPVQMAAGSAFLLERLPDFAPAELEGRPWTPGVLLEGGEAIEAAGIAFDVLFVPGHEPNHLAFSTGGHLFSGDVLFAGSVGRVDLPGGDWQTLLDSIRMLVEILPPDTVVHPGHGPETTLGAELARNPFLEELRA